MTPASSPETTAPRARTEAAAEHVGFLLIPQFSMIAFAAALEPLRLANRMSERPLYRWSLIAPSGRAVAASNGVPVGTEHDLGDAPSVGSVIVCGGIDSDRYQNPAVSAWLRRRAAAGAAIGATCTGSYILARAGLLDGYRCTVHWEHLAGWFETFPQIEVTGELFTVDRKRFTCAGGAASTDMMLDRIATRHGEALAAQVGEQMLHDRIRPGAMRQTAVLQLPAGADRTALQAAIRMMLEHIEDPLDLQTLADRLRLSRRNLERLFRKFLNISPAKYYLGLRLIRARQLLHQTPMPILEVAVSCGFGSATHFSRCYREQFGVAPRTDQIAQQFRPLAFAAAEFVPAADPALPH